MARVLSTSRALNGSPRLLTRLREAGHEVRVEDNPDLDDAAMLELARSHAALIVGIEPVTAEVIDNAPELRVIARPGAGYDRIDVPAATAAGVLVTTTPGANTDSVADHTIALLLVAARQVVELSSAVRAGQWPRTVGTELRECTLGLVGFGAIGRAVGARAAAFGMRVIATDPAPAVAAMAVERGVEMVSLDEVLSRSDVISLHAPGGADNRHLIDTDALDRVRPDAILVNTARGDLVDEAAVAVALRDGRLGAVAVDVLETEPPTASPLVGLDCAYVTPHVAAYTRAALDRMAERAIDAVLEALAGRRPPGLLNPDALDNDRRT